MATRITGSQRAARKRNIKVAQAANKRGGVRKVSISAKSRGYDRRIQLKSKTTKKRYKEEFKKAYKGGKSKPKSVRVAGAHKKALKHATRTLSFGGLGGGMGSFRSRETYAVPSGIYKPRRRRR